MDNMECEYKQNVNAKECAAQPRFTLPWICFKIGEPKKNAVFERMEQKPIRWQINYFSDFK